MKNIIYLLIVTFLMACSANNNDSIQQDNSNDTLKTELNANQADEIYFENEYFKIVKVSFEEFQNELKKIGVIVPKKNDDPNLPGYTETEALKKCKECKRLDKITLKVGDKIFKNNEGFIDDDTLIVGDSFVSYYLYDYVDGMAFIKVTYYESSGNIVYVLKSKQELNMWGYPIYCPSKKAMFVSNMDLVAGFENNGLQFFILKNGNWIKVWEKETDFGLQEIHKVNDSLIYAERVIMHFNEMEGMFDETQTVKIILK